MPITRIDHVQLAMPAGGEELARSFYGTLFGLAEVAKPVELKARGGCWFHGEGLRIHLGIDADFKPARKAHLAFRASAFPELLAALRAAGCTITEDGLFGGHARAYLDDPFGNRIELIEECT